MQGREPSRDPDPTASSVGVRHEETGRTALTLGVILVVVGAVLLVAQQLGFDWGDLDWPIWIVLPGVALLVAGLILPWGAGALIGGSILTMVGLLLAYQNATDHWESWAYAWALVAPFGSGAGSFLAGVRAGQEEMRRGGIWQMLIGLALFAVGYLFFEYVLNISGREAPLPQWAIPAALVVLGLLVLVRAITTPRPRAEQE